MFQLELHIPLTVVAAAASLTHQPELAFFDGHHDGFRKVYSVCIVWEVSHNIVHGRIRIKIKVVPLDHGYIGRRWMHLMKYQKIRQ